MALRQNVLAIAALAANCYVVRSNHRDISHGGRLTYRAYRDGRIVAPEAIPSDTPIAALADAAEALQLSLRDEFESFAQALQPFADMHRIDADPSEIACKRGTASDMTMITSGDFERANQAIALLSTYQTNLDHEILFEPLTAKQIRQRMSDQGRVTGVVCVTLDEIIDHDGEGLLDLLSDRLTGTMSLCDITYRVYGHERNELHIEVKGNVADVLEILEYPTE